MNKDHQNNMKISVTYEDQCNELAKNKLTHRVSKIKFDDNTNNCENSNNNL